MPLKLCAEGKMVTACLIGEIDHHGAGKLREEIDTMLERNHPDTLILDFREVTFMDSSGIGTGYGALSPDSGMEWVGGNPQPGSIHQKSNETGGTGQNCVDSFFAA